jgi:D-alanyl-D-alanine carboxypeptidase (penicillin-binding protein 5/6)
LSTNRSALSVLALAVALVPPPAPARAGRQPLPSRPTVTCAACIVTLGDDVIWGREIDSPRANASTTKMVTALVAVRAARLAEQVEVSAAAAATGGGGLDLRAGDRYSVEELLYALLLSSSNDAAVALAEHIAGSERAFVARMNSFAARLGARRSRFLTPHGLDVPGHYSTARDLARIALAVLRRPVLAQIVATPETTIRGTRRSHRLVNTNPLLETYTGAVGIKTGYTSGAGDVLVAAAARNGRRLIAVAMGSQSAADDARSLLDYGFALLGRSILVSEGTPVGVVVFDPSGAVTAVAGTAIRGLPDPASVRIELEPATVSPPVARGETVGTVVVETNGGEVVARGPAVAADGVPAAGGGASLLGTLLRTAAGLLGASSW